MQRYRSFEAARGYIGLGMLQEASEELYEIPVEERKNLSFIKLEIELLLAQGVLDQADTLLSAISDTCKRDPEWQYLRARFFARSSNFPEANRHLMKAIMLDNEPSAQILNHPDLDVIWTWSTN
ncbi:MAG: tetratricopeptide repeat protein [Verrucomicrobiota bacterium]